MTTALPKLCRGLAIVPGADGLLIEGGPRRHWLPGQAAALLPGLLDLLDGRHDRPAITGALGLTDRQLGRVLSVLGDCGLLEYPERAADGLPGEPGTGEPGTGTAAEVRAYLSRNLSLTGRYYSSAAALAALSASSVALVGNGPVAAVLAADLRDAGIGTVTLIRPGELADLPTDDRRAQLMVVLDDGPAAGTVEHVVASAGVSTPVLRIAAGPGYLDVGPAFRAGCTACPACLRRSLTEACWDDMPSSHEASDTATDWMLAGLAAGEIIATLAQITMPASARQLTRVWPGRFELAHRIVVPYPDCPACASQGPVEAPAATFEWQLGRRLGEPAWRGELAAAGQERLRQLQTVRPSFPTLPRQPMSAPDALPAPAGVFGAFGPAAPGRLSAELLAGLLMRAAGRRLTGEPPGSTRRWAPSGGNLASPAAYVVTGPRVADLPGNCLRYDDLAHALIALRPGTLPVAGALRGTDLAGRDLDAVVILVADVGRLARKYHDFAYRLAHLDAGCAAVQLAAAAAGSGLGVCFASSWDGQLAGDLDLRPGTEIITVIAGLQARRGEELSCP